jgi:hypothetical protein
MMSGPFRVGAKLLMLHKPYETPAGKCKARQFSLLPPFSVSGFSLASMERNEIVMMYATRAVDNPESDSHSKASHI